MPQTAVAARLFISLHSRLVIVSQSQQQPAHSSRRVFVSNFHSYEIAHHWRQEVFTSIATRPKGDMKRTHHRYPFHLSALPTSSPGAHLDTYLSGTRLPHHCGGKCSRENAVCTRKEVTSIEKWSRMCWQQSLVMPTTLP